MFYLPVLVVGTPPLHGGFAQVLLPVPPSFGGAVQTQVTPFIPAGDVHDAAFAQPQLPFCKSVWAP